MCLESGIVGKTKRPRDSRAESETGRRRDQLTRGGIRFAGLGGVGYPPLMSELIFMVEEAPEGGFTARALGEAIFTEADSMDDLRKQVADAVQCHFEPGKAPRVVRLHIVKEEILAA